MTITIAMSYDNFERFPKEGFEIACRKIENTQHIDMSFVPDALKAYMCGICHIYVTNEQRKGMNCFKEFCNGFDGTFIKPNKPERPNNCPFKDDPDNIIPFCGNFKEE